MPVFARVAAALVDSPTRHVSPPSGVENMLPRCCQTGAQSRDADQGYVPWLKEKPDERMIFWRLFRTLVNPATDIIRLCSSTSWTMQNNKGRSQPRCDLHIEQGRTSPLETGKLAQSSMHGNPSLTVRFQIWPLASPTHKALQHIRVIWRFHLDAAYFALKQ